VIVDPRYRASPDRPQRRRTRDHVSRHGVEDRAARCTTRWRSRVRSSSTTSQHHRAATGSSTGTPRRRCMFARG